MVGAGAAFKFRLYCSKAGSGRLLNTDLQRLTNVPKRNILEGNIPERNVPEQNISEQNAPERNVLARNVPDIKMSLL